MPAGDLVTIPFQWELRAYLMGQLSPWQNDRSQTIGGLGGARPKVSDLPYAQRIGSFGGTDLEGDKVITIPLFVDGSGLTDLARQESAMGHLAALRTAWAVSTADLRLDGFLPAWRFYVNGRPSGLDENLSLLTFGRISVLCTFETTVDPVVYTI